MRCRESRTRFREVPHQSGAVLVLASAFIFLLTYIALSTVDLAAVEARTADAMRVQADARTLLDAAIRIVVPQETARLREALARGDAPDCEHAGFCEGEPRLLALDGDDVYRVSYQTRVRGSAAGDGERARQAGVSSHLQYASGQYEVDVRIVRRADDATLARAGVGLRISAVREEGDE